MDVNWLASTIGQSVIRRANDFSDSLIANTTLRKEFPELDTTFISQAIAQANLRRKLQDRWQIDGAQFLLTEDGLNQATRPQVAHYRAQWIQHHFGNNAKIIDLTCGLGFDALAMAQVGLTVQAVELDPVTAECARHNLASVDAQVITGDATTINVSNVDVVFVDPARRDPNAARRIDGTTQRIFNPSLWSPSWEFINQLSLSVPVVAKVAPGIDEQLITDWDAMWISHDGDIVEAMLTKPISGNRPSRKAVLLSSQSSTQMVFEGESSPPIFDSGDFLVCPDGAITRAGALDVLAKSVHGGLVNEHIGWITTSDRDAVQDLVTLKPSPASCFEIIGQSKCDPKSLAMAIREVPASAITIMTRGVNVDVDGLRRKIMPALDKAAPELVLALYRDDGGNRALVTRRLQ